MSTFELKGGFAGLAATTRVRLARNVKGYPYRELTPGQLSEIADKVWNALQAAPALANEFEMQEVRAGSEQAMGLIETHKISPEFARKGGRLIVSRDGGVSIMLGEEDHIRLQVIGTGLCPKECMETARRLAGLIENSVPFDYSDKLGYLTACPSNLGTGLRASVMLHLPVLTESGALERMINWAARQGFTVRGAYGEGSRAAGGFYQISNQITLGLSEDAIIEKLIAVATEVIDSEKKAREQLRAQNEDGLFDQVARAAGTLMTARLLPSDEAADCISRALVGLQMGYLTGVSPEALVAAEQNTRPALLPGAPADRDRARAKALRAVMQNVRIAE
ncbi:MAG: ATP--guanido phosphotransferase [Butyricicoccus sp.]|nr:ATP--guanido phosphotransferase [Butyricicoccus sp.]